MTRGQTQPREVRADGFTTQPRKPGWLLITSHHRLRLAKCPRARSLKYSGWVKGEAAIFGFHKRGGWRSLPGLAAELGCSAHTKKASRRGKLELTERTWGLSLLRVVETRARNPEGPPATEQPGNKTVEEAEQSKMTGKKTTPAREVGSDRAAPTPLRDQGVESCKKISAKCSRQLRR